MTAQDIQHQFESIGGEFYLPVDELADRISNCRVFLFDWDGVFNEGMKDGGHGSPFGEADSMGVNLLRLCYWLKHGEMPVTGIITGATNEAAEYFAKREGLECCVRGFTDKGRAFQVLCEKMEINPEEVAFVFDDVLDLPVAEKAAVRFRVRRDNGPLFSNFIDENELCDYQTSKPGGQYAVREIAELIIGLCFDFDGAVKLRMEYGEKYQQYLAVRNNTGTLVISP